jgi:hypothetical protein
METQAGFTQAVCDSYAGGTAHHSQVAHPSQLRPNFPTET